MLTWERPGYPAAPRNPAVRKGGKGPNTGKCYDDDSRGPRDEDVALQCLQEAHSPLTPRLLSSCVEFPTCTMVHLFALPSLVICYCTNQV